MPPETRLPAAGSLSRQSRACRATLWPATCWRATGTRRTTRGSRASSSPPLPWLVWAWTRRRRAHRAHREDTSGWYSSRRVALSHTGSKVPVEEDTDRLLGAHLLGLHAEEVINLFGMAIRAELRASDLKTMVYAYPTGASDISYML